MTRRHPLFQFYSQEETTRELPTRTTDVGREAAAKDSFLLLSGAAIVLVGTLAACVLVYLLLFSTPSRPLVRCTSESCVAHSRRLQATLNTSVNPCHDFYAFVCSGWQSAFPHLSVQDKVKEDAISSNVKEITDDLWRVGRPSRLFYKCAAPESAEVDENLQLFKEFKEIISLYWPEKEPDPRDDHPLFLMIDMAMLYDINFLFNLGFGYSNVSGDVLIVRRGHRGVVWRDRIERPLSQLEYARNVREHLTALDVTSVESTATELQELERAFLVAIQPTAHTQQSWFAMGTLDSKTPSIGKGYWLNALRPHFIRLGFTISATSWVVLEDSKTLESIDGLFEAYGKFDLLIGIAWMFVQSHLWAITGKPELMFRDNIEEKKQHACLEYVNSRFGLLSSVRFATTRFPTPESRQQLASFFLSIKNAFKSLLKSASWVDRQSRETAERKIDALAISVLPAEPFFAPLQRASLYASFSSVEGLGFVEHWLVNLSEQYQNLRRHKNFKGVYSKRRIFRYAPYSYTYLLNEVDAPLAALEPPLLYADAPFAVNYASAGSLLAKEVAKSIDPRGALVDDSGENVIWWGKSHSAEYGRRISCDLGETGHPPMDLFPTIPALEASFSAYTTAVTELGVLEGRTLSLKLAGLEHYTEEQIFFMTYCYTLCSRKGADSAVHQCNVPLRHSLHFAEAFSCPPESPMNAAEKCTFFVSF
ncbi:hypothetical protein V5799_013205 [Amblyomma americanum]|uniref:M13 family peptidase n=1 Tax=Amblyomma americanum TaxID=6943 RepID=A0AAQ4E6M7_AMBAM